MLVSTTSSRQRVRAGASFLLGAVAPMLAASLCQAGVLLNDSWTDVDRTNTALPNNSATYVGVSTSDGGSLTVIPGALQNVMGTSSRKNWTYFTSDLSNPDGNQPHNAVTHLNAGDTLKTSLTFTLPNGATSASTSKDFRFGVFFDPTDPRVQTDVNSDGGGSTSPWADATGYALQMPLNGTATNSSPFQIVKRTASNTSLLGASGAFTNAPTGGSVYANAANTSYTVSLALNMVSASQLDVTATLSQGSTVLATQTVSDLGVTFGGAAVAAGGLPGSQSIYRDFDHLFFRMSSNTEASEIDFTNWRVELTSVPEPASLSVLSFGGIALLVRRRRASDRS
jgi:hypothetical protein